MTLPETPTQSDAEPDAQGDAESSTHAEAPVETLAVEPASAVAASVATDSGTNEGSAGETQDASAVTEGEESTVAEGEEGGAETDAPESAAKQAAQGGGNERPEKKKKRRRKKRKPHTNGEKRESAAPHRHRASDRAPFHVGEEVFGKVTAVLETAVMIDLSGKALAIFDRSEMEADDLVPAVGDRFVARVHNDGARGGLVVLTRKPLREEEIKPAIEQAAKDGTLVTGLVTGVIKGGVEVDVSGLRAFAPASGMDLHPANANFTSLLGQRLDFKVVQYEKSGRDLVVTRRPMLEAEAHERRKHALTLLQEGQVLNGVVRTVVEWGAFVALPEAENLEGLVHVSEASHDQRAPLSELFKPGDKFEVKITKIDERGKIWLSRKALIDDPWGQAREKFGQGTRHTGKVVRLEKFGAFVELEAGVEGLLHVADLSLERIEHPKDLLTEGQDLEVVVHHFDVRSKKISLHPAPAPERSEERPQRIQRNSLIKAEVVKAEAAGVIMRVLGVTGRAARGFMPAGQTGTHKGTDLRKVFKPGTVLDVKVLDVDPRFGEPKLSLRGFKEEEERRAHKEYRQKLKAEGGFGTLGDLLKKKLGSLNSEN